MSISIITPVFNGEKYLEECICSVLYQSHPYVEHILVDGGSKDGSIDILKAYNKNWPNRIRFISERDRGILDGTNKGLKMAKGEIFGWLGSDDTLDQNACYHVAKFFLNHPEASFLFGECHTINENGEIIATSHSKDFDLFEILNKENYISSTSSFYRREVVDEIGYYDIRLNDLDFLIRAGMAFQIWRIDEVLSNYRKCEESQTFNRKRAIKKVLADYLTSRKYGGKIFSGYGIRYFTYPLMEELLQPKNGHYGSLQKMMNRLYMKFYIGVKT
jgi:glycosyltransferase involved in cell wall biosynthesis